MATNPAALFDELGTYAPYTLHLKRAWRASVTEAGDVPLPRRPKPALEPWPFKPTHAAWKSFAWWETPIQLLVFGLGWCSPDVGLWRWRRMGYPTHDPILRTALAWWGPDGVVDVLAWAQENDSFAGYGAHLAHAIHGSYRTFDFPELRNDAVIAAARDSIPWHLTFGEVSHGTHLSMAASPALYAEGFNTPDGQRFDPTFWPSNVPPAVISHTYAGWYGTLIKAETDVADVFVKPIGWLGRYERSHATGVWHRAVDEEVHGWGNG